MPDISSFFFLTVSCWQHKAQHQKGALVQHGGKNADFVLGWTENESWLLGLTASVTAGKLLI